MMLNKLKSLFVTEVVEKESNLPKRDDMKENKSEPEVQDSIDAAPREEVDVPVGGQPSAEFMGILMNALQDARSEDFDYLHFKENLKSLDDLNFDQKTRFQTAFAIARNQGVNRELLIQSASFFLSVLSREEEKFKQTLEHQKNRRVMSKKDDIRKLREEIFKKQTEIEQLQEEIRKLESKIDGEKAELMNNRARIEKTSGDFSGTLAFLRKKIETDINNLKKYLDQ